MNDDFRRAPMPQPGEPITDYRTRLAMEHNHAVESRKRRLAEQTATQSAPGERIRLWERLHALTLPVDTGHALLGVIARDTGLTVEQVQEEQKQRSAAAGARQSAPDAGKIWDPYCTRPVDQRKPTP